MLKLARHLLFDACVELLYRSSLDKSKFMVKFNLSKRNQVVAAQSIAREEVVMSKGNPMPILSALEKASPVIKALHKVYGSSNVEVAGSCRRQCPDVRDVDIVVVGKAAMMPTISGCVVSGGIRRKDVLGGGVQVNIVFCEPEEKGSALLYFTGSKEFNIRTRSVAKARGLMLSDKGVFKGKDRIAGETERDCLAAIGLEWIEPKDRSR